MISSRAKVKKRKSITRKGAKRNPPPQPLTTHSPSQPAIHSNNNNNNSNINNNKSNSKSMPRQSSVPQAQRRKSTTPPVSNEKINLISAGIFALKNKSMSNAGLTTAPSYGLPAHSQTHTVQSQSTTDLVIFDHSMAHHNGGPGTATIALASTAVTGIAIADIDLIQINEMHETGFHASVGAGGGGGGNSTGGGIIPVQPVGKSKPPPPAKNSIAGVASGVHAKKKSRAQLAMNVFKTQTSASASNKEKKITKTLAIVLIVFLVCW